MNTLTLTPTGLAFTLNGDNYTATLPAELLPYLPSEADWETAIMTVEDAIAPIQKHVPQGLILHISSQLTALQDQHGKLYPAVLESAFQHISRYGRDPAVADTSSALRELLILREIAHHFHIAAYHVT